jgi:hypothetical protein
MDKRKTQLLQKIEPMLMKQSDVENNIIAIYATTSEERRIQTIEGLSK